MTDRATTPETPATTAGALGVQHDDDRADVLAQAHRERARRELTLAAIRSHLQEQPSARSVRSCARRWCRDIASTAEDVITARRNTETSQ